MDIDSNVIRFPEYPETRPSTSHEYAYLYLRHALMVGAIAPGISITIQELANQLEVSATPVREALRRLGSENALLTLKNRRIQVPEMTPARLEELTSLRCTLETHAAKRALPYINLVLIEAVERVEIELDQAVSAGDWASIVILNQRFHSTIYQANPQQIVMPMIESLWLQLGPFMGIAAQHRQHFDSDDHHKHLIEALRAGDENLLVGALESDIRDGIGPLIESNFEGLRMNA